MNRLGLLAVGAIALSLAAIALLFASQASPTSATPGSGPLYGTDAGAGDLYEINPTTGVGTLKGNMFPGGTASALASDPLTDILYVLLGDATNELYTVNPGDASVAFVGDGGLGNAGYGGGDFDASGQLWASANIAGDPTLAGSGSDHLVTINKATGVATVVGPFGVCTGVTIPNPGDPNGSCTIEGMDTIAFDSAGTLWGAKNVRGSSGTPGLYTINTGTGAATFVAAIDDAAAGFHPSGGVVSMQFACDGTLYAGTGRRVGGANTDGGKLGSINTSTGEFTFISASPITSGAPPNSLGGLAEIPSNCPFNVNKDFIPNNGGSVTVTLSCTDGGVATTVDGSASEADDANFTVTGYTLGSDPVCTANETGVPVGYLTSSCNAPLSVGVCTIFNNQTSTTFTVNKQYSPSGPVTPVAVTVTCSTGNPSPAGGSAAPGSPFMTTVTMFDQAGATCTANETVPAGYTASGNCTNVPIMHGVPAVCTITNTEIGAPTPTPNPAVGGLVALPVSGSGGSGGAVVSWTAVLAIAVAAVACTGGTLALVRRRS